MARKSNIAAASLLLSIACLGGAPMLADATPPSPVPVSPAAPAKPQFAVIQQDTDRLILELPNRLIVIAQEVHSAPVVSAQVWVKTGSVFEQEHVGAGLSHFLEHLLAGGETDTRSEKTTKQLLGSIGAQFNAMTSLDTVRYFINTTSDHSELAVDLLSDWMQHANITESEYKREREVIQREFEMGDGEPVRIFWKLTQLARYRHHPARHPTIGYLDEFRSISREEIQAFYKRMYVPNNMVFVVVGDIDKEKTVNQIATLWADAKPGQLPTIVLPKDDKPNGPVTASGIADIDKPRLRLLWPGTRLAQGADYALDVLAAVLGSGESSRLTQSIRDQQRLVNLISSGNMSQTWGEGSFFIDSEVVVPPAPEAPASQATSEPATQPDPAVLLKARQAEAIAKTRDAILAQVDKIAQGGVTDEELARVRRQILAGMVYDNQTAASIADRLAGDTIMMGDPDYLRHYSEKIASIDTAQVQAAAKAYLVPNQMLTLTLMPQPIGTQRTSLKRPTDAKVDGGADPEVLNLDNDRLIARLRKNVERNSAVEGGKLNRTLPPQKFTMPNGLRVIVQRNATVPAVSIQMYQLGGLLLETPGHEGLGNAAMAMLMRGTATRSANDISRTIENMGAAMSTQCGNNTSYLTATCLASDFDTVLNLFADVALHPAFADQEWERMRPRLVASIARQTETWSGELGVRFRETYFGSHPWSQVPAGRANVVASLTTADLRAYYQQHLIPSESVITVVGDIDPQAAYKKVEALFGSLPSGNKSGPLAQPAPPTPQTLQIQTLKPLAAVRIGYGPGITRTSPDYAKAQVLSRIMSAFPAGRLEQELRGRGPGLVYAVGAGSAIGLVPGYFGITFNTEPSKVPEALHRAVGVVERIKTEKVTDSDLVRAKASLLTDEFMNKQSNADLAADDSLNELYGLGLDEPRRYLEEVNQVTPESLLEFAQKALAKPVILVITHDPVADDVLQNAAKP